MNDEVIKEANKLMRIYGFCGSIEEFRSDVAWWFHLSCFQILSEDFIREFKDEVNWSWVSQYQTLSEDFIREFKNKLNITILLQRGKTTQEFINRINGIPKISRFELMIIE